MKTLLMLALVFLVSCGKEKPKEDEWGRTIVKEEIKCPPPAPKPDPEMLCYAPIEGYSSWRPGVYLIVDKKYGQDYIVVVAGEHLVITPRIKP